MKILVLSPVSFPARNKYLPDWSLLQDSDHQVFLNEIPIRPDVILSMSVSVTEKTFAAVDRWPASPLYCYNWDCYSWTWTRPRVGEYDYRRYGELLRLATEIWVPSACTGRQTSLWWSLYNWHVIRPSCPFWDHDHVRDEGFALCPLRKLPDHWCGHFERACTDLSIPFKMTDHSLSYEAYQDAVASCRFLVSHYQEASTGGLTLLEGYYLGKPVLLTDSEWNGAGSYFGTRATYFRHGNFGNFKHWLKAMYDIPRPVPEDHRQWILDNHSDRRMIADILERINAHS